MFRLTDAQVEASASPKSLLHVVSSPGSGKTTVACERFGYLRYSPQRDLRGVLGLSFTRSAAGELRSRVEGRWGSGACKYPNFIGTYDSLHVAIFRYLLRSGYVVWPAPLTQLEVVDDYSGYPGYRWLSSGGWRRLGSLSSQGTVVSSSVRISQPRAGIGRKDQHEAVLRSGVISHEDVRSILERAFSAPRLVEVMKEFLARTVRAVVVDEVYDADGLDLTMAALAIEAGCCVTTVGDPWQALCEWRGATPRKVQTLLDAYPFEEIRQEESFRFKTPEMQQLASDLRSGQAVQLDPIASEQVDVALARNWASLWGAGTNILPLAFRSSPGNMTDAALCLLLDAATRASLGRAAYGLSAALVRLGLTLDDYRAKCQSLLDECLKALFEGQPAETVLTMLRLCVLVATGKTTNRLQQANETVRLQELQALRLRLTSGSVVVPGLTVHQAKGREWPVVGVYLTAPQRALLHAGLTGTAEEECIVYVALTRAQERCGLLLAPGELPIS